MEPKKEAIKRFFDSVAPTRDKWLRRNRYYYRTIEKIFTFFIPQGSSVLELGSGTGNILSSLRPKEGLGIDLSEKMVEVAKRKHPHLAFEVMDAEDLRLSKKFDYIVLGDLAGYLIDVQKAFIELKKVSHPHTKVLITSYNYIWEPFLKFAELIRLRMPSPIENRLSLGDIQNLLYLADFEVVKQGEELLLPIYIPLLSELFNRFLARLPLLRRLCLVHYFIAKPIQKSIVEHTVSVIIPARNEKGNIEAAVTRLPQLGTHTEIIFVEGGSRDGTAEEIEKVIKKYPEKDIKFFKQDGKGKGNAVRKGFEVARGEVLMILDADLTVQPEDLHKFYYALVSGKGEFINGSRLVYPMENEAMRTLNLFANKFFGVMFSWILGQRLKDTLCGTKVLFKTDYEKVVAGRKFFGNFDPFGDFDLIFGAAKLGLKIVDLPIRYKARVYGSTNIQRWKHGWLLLKMTAFAMFKIKFI